MGNVIPLFKEEDEQPQGAELQALLEQKCKSMLVQIHEIITIAVDVARSGDVKWADAYATAVYVLADVLDAEGE